MIKRNKPLNKYSLKRIDKMNAELPERIKLIERCGGKPYFYIQTVKHNGASYTIRRVACIGGICECGCNKPANFQNGQLEPHEKVRRSKNGVVSSENSIMVLRECHRRLDGRNPKLEWIK